MFYIDGYCLHRISSSQIYSNESFLSNSLENKYKSLFLNWLIWSKFENLKSDLHLLTFFGVLNFE
ncbi:MAG: hypothetical protein A2Y13_04070 [Planctomycetes bacterium GWC2_45_44]|nr:MAG: hypothetical protein A2Y13_04070 [Planctomycetes bacterium GWC2_45_44]HBR19869.1 hypothetical protein [Phycisphaerales bacterium]